MRQTGTAGATNFVFDDHDALAERSSSGGWTFRLPGVGYVENGAQFYERENAQGSTVSTVDATGALVSRTFYDAYGVDAVMQSGPLSRYRYTGAKGYAADDASGMLLLGARFYVPGIGRFLTPDPRGHEGGFNLYAYCANNPLGKTDPTGHGPDWFNTFSNFAAGMGDGISGYLSDLSPGYRFTFGSVSPTQLFRRSFGYDGNVDFSSGAYSGGGIGSDLWGLGLAFAIPGEMSPNSLKVMVGRGSSLHTVYEVGGELIYGGGLQKGSMVVSKVDPVFARVISIGGWKPWLTFRVPISNVEAASRTGMQSYNCVTAAMKAVLRGWGF